MKRFISVLLGMVVLLVLPAYTFGQGFLGGYEASGIAGLPSLLPNLLGGAKDSRFGVTGAPTVYFGWLEDPKGSKWALQRQTSTGTAPWPLKGFWLGVSKDFFLNDGLDLLISASVFLPRRSTGTWYEEPPGRAFNFEIPSYDWWTVDGLTKYGFSDTFEFLAGFRWDHTSTRVNYSDNTKDDYILNAYIPLFGMQVNQRFAGGALLVRAVGSPLIFGLIRYHFWDQLGYSEFGDFPISNGYLAEILADYSLKIRSDLSMGAFVKWNALHVKTAEQSLSGSTTEPVSWTVDIRSWTIGAILSVEFSSPI